MDTTEQPQEQPQEEPVVEPQTPPTATVPAPHTGPEQRHQVHLRYLVDRFGHIVLDVSAYLGRSKMTLRTLLALNSGNIVRLDREVGQRLDLRLNGEPFGHVDVRIDDDMRRLQITRIGVES